MVEEHSANLTARIDPECPSSTPTPSRETHDPKRSDYKDTSSILISEIADRTPDSLFSADPEDTNNKKVNLNVETECSKTDNNLNLKQSTETKRSKSLGNANSVDSSEETKSNKDGIKKCKSAPLKTEVAESAVDVKKPDKEFAMTVQESTTPIVDRDTPDSRGLEKPESPKPGCSSQQDFGTARNFLVFH